MKKILSFLCLLGLAGTLNANPDHVVIPVAATNAVAFSASNSIPVSGYIESIYIKLPIASYTCTVVVATAQETNIWSGTLTASDVVYPRVTVCSAVNSTNALTTTRRFLVKEFLTLTVKPAYETAVTERTTTADIKMNDK